MPHAEQAVSGNCCSVNDMMVPTNRSDRAGLRPLVTHFFSKPDLTVQVQFIKPSIQDGIAVKIDASTIRCFDKTIVFHGKQF